MAEVLIIDDDRQMCKLLASRIRFIGHNAVQASTLSEGLAHAETGAFDVVFLDVYMPDGNGLESVPALRKTPSRPEIIIITGRGDRDGAETAISSGAWDYVQKGDSLQDMILPLSRALQYREEKAGQKPPVLLKRDGIIGDSAVIQDCFQRLSHIAASEASVHITGETGTGKEVFARAVHDNSPRSGNSFVVVDCASIPDHLVESILFGNTKGAFTGAHQSREGLLKQADGGTLFLDEVGELPLAIQKSFLRALQERRFRPVGAPGEVSSDFRLISATNCKLEEMVENGQFRKDLLYRLRSQEIELPPLRKRQGDIRLLTLHHLHLLGEKQGVGTKGVSEDFWQALEVYDWPGNIRELINVLEGALLSAADAPTIFARHLPTQIRVSAARHLTPGRAPSRHEAVSEPAGKTGQAVSPGYAGGPVPESASHAGGRLPDGGMPTETIPRPDQPVYGDLPPYSGEPADRGAQRTAEPQEIPPLKEARAEVIARFENRYLTELLDRTNGNIKESCAIAGVSRQHLHNLLQKYGIRRSG